MAIVSIQSAYPPRPRGGAADRCRLRARRGVGARPRQLGRAHRGGRGRRHQGAGVQPAAGTPSCCCWRLEDHDNQPRVTCLLHSRVNRAINIPSVVRLLQVAQSLCHVTNQPSQPPVPRLSGDNEICFTHFHLPASRLVPAVSDVCRLLGRLLSSQFYIPAAAASSLHLGLGAEGRMLGWAGLGWALGAAPSNKAINCAYQHEAV